MEFYFSNMLSSFFTRNNFMLFISIRLLKLIPFKTLCRFATCKSYLWQGATNFGIERISKIQLH